MEPLSQDDPRRLGPYHVIARLGPDAGEVPATARHFIARDAAGDRTVVVTAPSHELADDVLYRERFLAEAENARLLGGGRPPLWLAGKRLWTRDGLRPAGQPWVADGDALVVPGDGLVALEPRTGRIQWHSSDFRQGARSSFTGLLAVAGSTVWFTATVRNESGGANGDRVVVAYDVRERAELWRGPVAAGLDEGHLLKDALVVMAGGDQDGTGAKRAVAFSRDHGKELWQRVYPGMTAKGL